MYAAIRHSTVTSVDTVVQRLKEDFWPNVLEKLPGFSAYYFFKVSAEELYTVNIFETKEQADESNRVVADWVRQNLSELVITGPDTVVGELLYSSTAKPKEFPGEMAA